jgi:D-alanyl-lipoteichoic acid acyltransferase DltB (MBOAT superfamily)
MLFNSIPFLIFFPTVVVLYFATPQRYRWALLLGASYYFYMSWRPEYVILIIVSTLIDYVAARQIGQTANPTRRKTFLALSLLTNLGILFGFKYFNLFNDSARAIFDQFNLFYNIPAFEVLLPVGISFYTLQSMGYTIDVFRGQKTPERHLGIFALYVAFFPQLVAGPIERSVRLLPQFYQKHSFDLSRIGSGLQLMAWGFFKKVVIADRLAFIVNGVYNDPTAYSGLPLLLTTYFFAFQIYCDFSGYSDIAIGAARVMGYDLMENFRRPYFAPSVADFWRRWHISLSTWFRDYLYIPLGGNRVTPGRWSLNLMIVFLVSGLWHGAEWTFVVWGGLHGLYLLGEIWLKRAWGRTRPHREPAQPSFWRQAGHILLTFHLVTFAWIFFRANSVGEAFYIATHLFTTFDVSSLYGLEGGHYNLSFALILIAFLLGVQLLHTKKDIPRLFALQPVWLRWAVYYAFIFTILAFGQFGTVEFIYFQF